VKQIKEQHHIKMLARLLSLPWIVRV